jgi:uncharacterized membrane protein
MIVSLLLIILILVLIAIYRRQDAPMSSVTPVGEHMVEKLETELEK